MKASSEQPQEGIVHRCVTCGIASPATETNYTLISSRYGWRLTRSFAPDGRKVMEWRCPECYARYKTSNNPVTAGLPPPPPSSAASPPSKRKP